MDGTHSTDGTDSTDGELQDLRDSTERAVEREGIPMVLGLVDERAGHRVPPAPDAAPDGARLAASLIAHRDRLAPTQRDDDQMTTITLITATAFADFDRSRR